MERKHKESAKLDMAWAKTSVRHASNTTRTIAAKSAGQDLPPLLAQNSSRLRPGFSDSPCA